MIPPVFHLVPGGAWERDRFLPRVSLGMGLLLLRRSSGDNLVSMRIKDVPNRGGQGVQSPADALAEDAGQGSYQETA